MQTSTSGETEICRIRGDREMAIQAPGMGVCKSPFDTKNMFSARPAQGSLN